MKGKLEDSVDALQAFDEEMTGKGRGAMVLQDYLTNPSQPFKIGLAFFANNYLAINLQLDFSVMFFGYSKKRTSI